MICYLLHLDAPLHHARHYLGACHDLKARLARHARGDGARILRAAKAAGIGWNVVRTWEGGHDVEKRLKAKHDGPGLCPICAKERECGKLKRYWVVWVAGFFTVCSWQQWPLYSAFIDTLAGLRELAQAKEFRAQCGVNAQMVKLVRIQPPGNRRDNGG